MVKFTYYGHACFLLENDHCKILTDPFLTGNPLAAIAPDIVEADYILLSHAHSDHLGDAPEIAKRTEATVVGIPEVLAVCTERMDDIKTHPMNIGGSCKTSFGKLRMTLAIHSSGVAGGIACGYVIKIDGMHIYFAGDTALFQGMQVIGQKESIDYAVLPIGDNYTMGLEDAALAAQWLNTRNVIPIHYNTWPIIEQDVDKYKELTERLTRATVHIVKPGESLRLA
ncbi:metal-dependent hydrolase [Selenomonas sp. TAMA-11512]|uniref:metal-dependent hydrolase n=1 Tax=Selenomonas sp. TAMA-11512 TaxID=3095337 RepID=UPI003088C54A|nr:metal-dependent hydrolase [Selenomonas sp. TAMA-11512]